MQDDLFALEVVHDPYAYFGRLREADPVHAFRALMALPVSW